MFGDCPDGYDACSDCPVKGINGGGVTMKPVSLLYNSGSIMNIGLKK